MNDVYGACVLLQDLYEKAGLEGERIVFLLTDTQITHEAFLEVRWQGFSSTLERLRAASCASSYWLDQASLQFHNQGTPHDAQVVQDINNLLNSGEVPGMFGLEDKERLAASMRERIEVGEQVASKVRHTALGRNSA